MLDMESEMSDETPKLTRNGSTRNEPKLRRPCVAIYRPPGLRSNQPTNSRPTEDTEKPTVGFFERKETDQVSNASSDSRSSTTTDARKTKDNSRMHSKTPKEEKKKTLSSKEIGEIESIVRQLELTTDREVIDKFFNEHMENVKTAENLAHCLCHYAIEEKRREQRQVARLCSLLMDSPSGVAFQRGVVSSINQYFDCRGQLRSSHIKVWIDFLSFTSDIYTHTQQNEIIDVLYKIFDYLLKSPILETLKIEEMECMISTLLQIGYDLERNCPQKLVELKTTIRNAFLELSEPWSRKMILLLIELCASNWTLSPDANEYYFQ
ncbi:hypothetical protein M3Y96_00662000 [Aphelenchoides besseyi]|nr:hypothetical protein M3Y96_00662000 [Aphelenchoides besseyi]